MKLLRLIKLPIKCTNCMHHRIRALQEILTRQRKSILPHRNSAMLRQGLKSCWDSILGVIPASPGKVCKQICVVLGFTMPHAAGWTADLQGRKFFYTILWFTVITCSIFHFSLLSCVLSPGRKVQEHKFFCHRCQRKLHESAYISLWKHFSFYH